MPKYNNIKTKNDDIPRLQNSSLISKNQTQISDYEAHPIGKSGERSVVQTFFNTKNMTTENTLNMMTQTLNKTQKKAEPVI